MMTPVGVNWDAAHGVKWDTVPHLPVAGVKWDDAFIFKWGIFSYLASIIDIFCVCVVITGVCQEHIDEKPIKVQYHMRPCVRPLSW